MALVALPTPPLMYGTAWKEERTEKLTALALDSGFVGIDTANQRKHYFEKAVGQAVQAAIARGKVTRDSLFLQSKFTFKDGQDHRLPYDPEAPVAQQVLQSFTSSLEHFATDYLDSYLLHGPSSRSGLNRDDLEAWRAIEALAESAKTRHIGVSNFTAAQLRELVAISREKPSFVQNRCYARTGWDREVRAVCREHGIIYQGFSLLTANRSEIEGPVMRKLAARTKRTPHELVFRFALDAGMLPLTGTSSAEHMRLDLGVLDFRLDPVDVAAIEKISG